MDFYTKIRDGLAREPLALDPFQLRLARAIKRVPVRSLAETIAAQYRDLHEPTLRVYLSSVESYLAVSRDPSRQCTSAKLIAALAAALDVPEASLMGDQAQLDLSRQRFLAWSRAGRPPVLTWVRAQEDPYQPEYARWLPTQRLTGQQMANTIAACLHVAAWHYRVATTFAQSDPKTAAEHREMGRVVQAIALSRADATWPKPD